MNRSPKKRHFVVLAIMFTMLTALCSLHAALIVNTTVTPINNDLFNYDFSITNNDLEDVSIVSIVDAPFGDLNIDPTLVAPAGFIASYDLGLGIVDFLEDTDVFAIGTTRVGFTLTSAFGPVGNFMAFEALTVNGNLMSGQVQKDVRPDGVIPEPGTMALLAFGLGCLGVISFRKEVVK